MSGARGALRSSARLSTGGASGGTATAAAGEARAAARRAEAAAAAARRRARAAERAREVEDSPQELRMKCKKLADALRNAKHLVVYTGAGISTAADIPDYRGPRGVWTRLRRGESVGRVEVSSARPTLTHMALTALWARGTLKFVVSQNCDGLHLRAGLPRRALAELHGNMFAERCAACRRVYLRAFDTTERTARHAHGTRRLCHRCGAELTDTIVHFGERGRARWPLNWAGALHHAARADVVLCLGSSLKVLRRYPRLWRMQRAPADRPALYIVNLQWTPKDDVAALKINARCDAVMAQVARRLSLCVPRYCERLDPLLAHAVPLAPGEAHTTRRPLLVAPPPASLPRGYYPPCSPSLSSDSDDDEVPLRRLAERMRAPPSPPPPPAPPPPVPRNPSPAPRTPPPARSPLPPTPNNPPPAPHNSPPAPPVPAPARPRPRLPPPPDLLHAFQVNMCSGDATILLRAHHAPSAQPPRRVPSGLRLFRMHRPVVNGRLAPPGNGLRLLAPVPQHQHTNGHVKVDVKLEEVKKEEGGILPLPRAGPMAVDLKSHSRFERLDPECLKECEDAKPVYSRLKKPESEPSEEDFTLPDSRLRIKPEFPEGDVKPLHRLKKLEPVRKLESELSKEVVKLPDNRLRRLEPEFPEGDVKPLHRLRKLEPEVPAETQEKTPLYSKLRKLEPEFPEDDVKLPLHSRLKKLEPKFMDEREVKPLNRLRRLESENSARCNNVKPLYRLRRLQSENSAEREEGKPLYSKLKRLEPKTTENREEVNPSQRLKKLEPENPERENVMPYSKLRKRQRERSENREEVKPLYRLRRSEAEEPVYRLRRLEPEYPTGRDVKPLYRLRQFEQELSEEREASALAAAIIARAMLLCRAQLYPGLHTILAPQPPAPAACAWCARHYPTRRCHWYGPPPASAPQRRRACACCERGRAPEPAPPGGGGWYGKGYRKGRRQRR